MKRPRTKTVVIILVVVVAVGLAAATLLSRQPAEPLQPTVSPTPTADPYAQDRAILGELSKDFGAKFFTYQKPNDPAYFDSIRPYMTPEFFTENKRITDRETYAISRATPIRSTVQRTEVTEIDGRSADVTIHILTEESGDIRDQTVMLSWVKQGQQWKVNTVKIGGTVEVEGGDV